VDEITRSVSNSLQEKVSKIGPQSMREFFILFGYFALPLSFLK